jgi:hypothetical protein
MQTFILVILFASVDSSMVIQTPFDSKAKCESARSAFTSTYKQGGVWKLLNTGCIKSTAI